MPVGHASLHSAACNLWPDGVCHPGMTPSDHACSNSNTACSFQTKAHLANATRGQRSLLKLNHSEEGIFNIHCGTMTVHCIVRRLRDWERRLRFLIVWVLFALLALFYTVCLSPRQSSDLHPFGTLQEVCYRKTLHDLHASLKMHGRAVL